jgi:hypothetical protein
LLFASCARRIALSCLDRSRMAASAARYSAIACAAAWTCRAFRSSVVSVGRQSVSGRAADGLRCSRAILENTALVKWFLEDGAASPHHGRMRGATSRNSPGTARAEHVPCGRLP